MSALEIIERVGLGIGFHLPNLCSIFLLRLMNLSTPFLPFREGFSLLGCPVEPPDFCEATFQTRVDKIKLSLSLALPKVVSVLRACPPGRTTAHNFDCSIRRALESILGGPLSDWSWQKASLPCSKGGLGLRSAPLHAPALLIQTGRL